MATKLLTDFQRSSPELVSSPAPEILKFEREDWTLFRTVEGLQQKAGVPKQRLRRLVLKELADKGGGEGSMFHAIAHQKPPGCFVCNLEKLSLVFQKVN